MLVTLMGQSQLKKFFFVSTIDSNCKEKSMVSSILMLGCRGLKLLCITVIMIIVSN